MKWNLLTSLSDSDVIELDWVAGWAGLFHGPIRSYCTNQFAQIICSSIDIYIHWWGFVSNNELAMNYCLKFINQSAMNKLYYSLKLFYLIMGCWGIESWLSNVEFVHSYLFVLIYLFNFWKVWWVAAIIFAPNSILSKMAMNK